MKEITLICDKPYAYKCDISVYDYHNDGLRKRYIIRHRAVWRQNVFLHVLLAAAQRAAAQ